jgi:hypothetical protein
MQEHIIFIICFWWRRSGWGYLSTWQRGSWRSILCNELHQIHRFIVDERNHISNEKDNTYISTHSWTNKRLKIGMSSKGFRNLSEQMCIERNHAMKR